MLIFKVIKFIKPFILRKATLGSAQQSDKNNRNKTLKYKKNHTNKYHNRGREKIKIPPSTAEPSKQVIAQRTFQNIQRDGADLISEGRLFHRADARAKKRCNGIFSLVTLER